MSIPSDFFLKIFDQTKNIIRVKVANDNPIELTCCPEFVDSLRNIRITKFLEFFQSFWNSVEFLIQYDIKSGGCNLIRLFIVSIFILLNEIVEGDFKQGLALFPKMNFVDNLANFCQQFDHSVAEPKELNNDATITFVFNGALECFCRVC